LKYRDKGNLDVIHSKVTLSLYHYCPLSSSSSQWRIQTKAEHIFSYHYTIYKRHIHLQQLDLTFYRRIIHRTKKNAEKKQTQDTEKWNLHPLKGTKLTTIYEYFW